MRSQGHRVARRCWHRPAPSERRMRRSPPAAHASQTPDAGRGHTTVTIDLRSDRTSRNEGATGRLSHQATRGTHAQWSGVHGFSSCDTCGKSAPLRVGATCARLSAALECGMRLLPHL